MHETTPSFLDEEMSQLGSDSWTSSQALVLPDKKGYLATPSGDLIGFIPSVKGATPVKAIRALEKLAIDRFQRVGKALGYQIT